MGIRQKLAQKLINTGVKLQGETPVIEPSITKSTPPKRTGGAVVEAVDDPVRWTPNQQGNVVIVEPDIVTQFRRESHDDTVPGM